MWGSTSALVSWGGVARRHPLELDAPLAVAFEVQKGDRRVAVLLPGGVTMVAGAERTPAGDVSRQQLFGSPGFASAVLLKLPIGIVQKPAYLIPYHKFFSARLSRVRRGPCPGYIVSTTAVRVTCPGSEAGKVVELRVTEHVATLGYPTILSMTWQDTYRIAPAVDGPVDFPGVIVATGRVPPTPPPPGVSYTAQVQAKLTSPTGFGCRPSSTCIWTETGSHRDRWGTTRAIRAGRLRYLRKVS